MGKIAFVFSGQGDQYPGMGRELANKYPAAAKVYEICDSIRPGTSRQCFEGTDEELKETKNTQPCLFATELATAAALTSQIVLYVVLPVIYACNIPLFALLYSYFSNKQ